MKILYYLTSAVYSPSSDPATTVLAGWLAVWLGNFVRACIEKLLTRSLVAALIAVFEVALAHSIVSLFIIGILPGRVREQPLNLLFMTLLLGTKVYPGQQGVYNQVPRSGKPVATSGRPG